MRCWIVLDHDEGPHRGSRLHFEIVGKSKLFLGSSPSTKIDDPLVESTQGNFYFILL